jgi:hypothetical protein
MRFCRRAQGQSAKTGSLLIIMLSRDHTIVKSQSSSPRQNPKKRPVRRMYRKRMPINVNKISPAPPGRTCRESLMISFRPGGAHSHCDTPPHRPPAGGGRGHSVRTGPRIPLGACAVGRARRSEGDRY